MSDVNARPHQPLTRFQYENRNFQLTLFIISLKWTTPIYGHVKKLLLEHQTIAIFAEKLVSLPQNTQFIRLTSAHATTWDACISLENPRKL